MKTIRFNKWMAIAAIPVLLAFTDSANATVTYNFNSYYTADSISPTPVTTTWLTLQVKDTGSNQVSLEFSAPGLILAEYVDSWYLNFGSSAGTGHNDLDPTKLYFTSGSVTPGGTYPGMTYPDITIGQNDQIAGGSIPFDIKLAFQTSNKDNGNLRFNAGDILTYTVKYTGATAFDETSFGIESSKDPFGPFAMVAHVNGIPSKEGTGSAWVQDSIPEPSAGVLSMLTATACCVFARKRRDLQV